MVQGPGESKNNPQKQADIPFLRVVLSVIQASFGVQNPANRERDFGSRSIWPYVAAALIFTVLFVLSIAFVVTLVLPD